MQISQKNTCVGVSLLKETPAQLFSSEIYKFFKNTFFYRPLPVDASESSCCYSFWQVSFECDGKRKLSIYVGSIVSPHSPKVHKNYFSHIPIEIVLCDIFEIGFGKWNFYLYYKLIFIVLCDMEHHTPKLWFIWTR